MKHIRPCLALFVIAGCLFVACRSSPTLFKKISANHSGIHFNNSITENDSINPIDLEFLYNGGGVATGDFNNDGLPDLYFTASTTSNKLYLNKGNLVFKDITEAAHAGGEGRWCNAASVVDINNDGWEDIYVCTTIKSNPAERTNLLYINQGLNKDKIPVFKEMAANYQLADTSYSVHAAFFDYDNDGDLDLYLVTTKLAGRNGVQFNVNTADTASTDVDKLFRNDWSNALHHPVFTDVSKQAGIRDHGFGLGISIVDINRDGWKDIYVTNDFYSNDALYINNHNGNFTNKVNDYFKHTSQNAMGSDVADINNDGLLDIIAADMNPEDNFRKKKNMGGNNYYVYLNMIYGQYNLQYIRNTLQLNMGPRPDSTGDPVFSEIGYYAGVAETDWSWTPSLADFDNDGYRDLIITNGYPRDVTDHDFAAFRSRATPKVSKQELIDQIPQIKIPNYAYRNNRQLRFEQVTTQWGLDQPSFSNGAIYVDLDNDGDLDYVVNNINEKAFVYENTINSTEKTNANFLHIQFKGDEANKQGIGAFAELYYDKQLQVYENSPYRGYLSTVSTRACFGLGSVNTIDSIVITWPNNKKRVLTNVSVNQVLLVDIKNAVPGSLKPTFTRETAPLFSNMTDSLGITYQHKEMDYVDFDNQRLLPHKLSQYGPGLAAGDVDGNGLDDMVIGGNSIQEPVILLQQNNGNFIQTTLPPPTGNDARKPETMGILLFDADNDKDLDILMASGSNEYVANTKNYEDRLYSNDGKGHFTIDDKALPTNYTSKSCVKAADFDHDGDLDLFVGGRVLPGKYPQPVNSYIYRNDSRPGQIQFTDITAATAPALQTIGLVCDALWTDYDNDGWEDLLIAGEWMPLTFLHNNKGKLQAATKGSGLENQTGWWNSLTAGDFDNDGDIDYIAGNLGENSFYRASEQFPASIYGKDFDKNGGFDIIPTLFLKDQDGQLKEFTAQNRDDMVEQLPVIKKQFLTYKEFGKAELTDIFPRNALQDALTLKATNFRSCFIKNTGQGKFECHPLPAVAQWSPLYGMIADDINQDGNLDLIATGNDYGTEVSIGRYDACNGLVLTGDGQGHFTVPTLLQSGFYVPGDAKACVKLKHRGRGYLLAASQNRDALEVFHLNSQALLIPVQYNDKAAFIHLKNGRIRKEELYYGTSFLSQSSRFLVLDEAVDFIEIINDKGEKRNEK